MPIPLTRDELRRKDGRWLLELDYPGGMLRVADQEAEVSSDDGTLVYQSGLDPLDLSLQEDLNEISVTITIPDVDLVRALSRGYVLERMSAELSRWYEGETYERRRVVLTGVILGITFGAPGAIGKITGTLTQTSTSLGNPIVSLKVTKEDMDVGFVASGLGDPLVSSDCPSLGLYIPKIIGYPTGKAVPALELSMTEQTITDSKNPRWVIASHAIEADGVYIYTDRDVELLDGSGTTGYGEPITRTTDLGTTTQIVLTAASPFADDQVNTGGSFFVGFSKATGGGMLNPYRSGALLGLSDVLRTLYAESSGRKVDHGRFESYAAELNAIEVSTFINEPTTVDEWVKSHILSIPYPVRIIEGPKGLYARRRTYRPEAEDAVAVLSTAGLGGSIAVSRQTGLEPERVDVYNRIQVNYKPHAAGNTFAATIEISPTFYDFNETATAVSNAFNQMTHICEVSANLFGERLGVFDLRDCYDPTTATIIAAELLFRHALPRYQVTYEGGRDLESLEVGDVVLLTDDELEFTERVCTVEDVLYGQAASQVRLEVRTDPLAFDVSTS